MGRSGSVADLEPGKVHRITYAVKSKDAWRNVEREGVIYALTEDGTSFTIFDATCTHLGCSVRWKEEDNHFACPCHAGIFSREGEVLDGPPPRPLVKLETKLEGWHPESPGLVCLGQRCQNLLSQKRKCRD